MSTVNSGAALRASSECSRDTTDIMVSKLGKIHDFDEMHDTEQTSVTYLKRFQLEVVSSCPYPEAGDTCSADGALPGFSVHFSNCV